MKKTETNGIERKTDYIKITSHQPSMFGNKYDL